MLKHFLLDRPSREWVYRFLSVIIGLAIVCFCPLPVCSREAQNWKFSDGTQGTGEIDRVEILLKSDTKIERRISYSKLSVESRKELIAILQKGLENENENDLHGTVTEVLDGDTVRFRDTKGVVHLLRLGYIDAPESNQPFGKEATEFLGKMLTGKEVVLKLSPLNDKYNRLLGDIYLEGRWIALELVENGCAWNYTTYSDSKELARLEKEAREAKRGLWVDSVAVPPWEFRKMSAAEKQAVRGASNENLKQIVTDFPIKQQPVLTKNDLPLETDNSTASPVQPDPPERSGRAISLFYFGFGYLKIED